MRCGGLIVLATVASLLTSTVFAEGSSVDLRAMGKETVRQVQSVLAEFGYSPGSADGVVGRRTERAISAFRKDTGVGEGHAVDLALLLALGIEKQATTHSAAIYVSTEPSHELGSRLEKLKRDDLLSELDKLALSDRKQIDLEFSPPKSIIFVVYSPLEDKEVVRTVASNIISGKKSAWSETYNYPIGDWVPTEPLVIINEFETSNPMFIVHEMWVGRELVATKLTRAH